MDSQVGVVVRVAVFNDNVVADLKADSVAVAVAGFDMANRVTIAVLQEDAAARIAVQIGVVLPITIECQILGCSLAQGFLFAPPAPIVDLCQLREVALCGP